MVYGFQTKTDYITQKYYGPNTKLWLRDYMDLLDKERHWVPGDAVKTLVVPALSWLVALGVVALTTYGVISGGVVGSHFSVA